MITYRNIKAISEMPTVRLYAHDADWADIDLSDTVLPSPDLDRAQLLRCKFDYCRVMGGSYCEMRCEKVSATGAIVGNCYVQNARFIHVSFTGSSIRDVIFKNCSFIMTDFEQADLSDTHFIDCSFRGCLFLDAKGCNADTFNENCEFNMCSGIPDIPMVCPETGGFVAYKKVMGYGHDGHGDYVTGSAIAELYIPPEAKRSSGLGRKCRCEYAMVLGIKWVRDSTACIEYAKSNYVSPILAEAYIDGKTVYADKWDEYRWNECSHGIHFFMTEREALAY